MVLGDIVRANRNGRDVYQRDIEQWFNIRRSSVTALLQGMAQDGFITRCAVEKDARLKRLVATDKGRAAGFGRQRRDKAFQNQRCLARPGHAEMCIRDRKWMEHKVI